MYSNIVSLRDNIWFNIEVMRVMVIIQLEGVSSAF